LTDTGTMVWSCN